jgi:hypothetical protein
VSVRRLNPLESCCLQQVLNIRTDYNIIQALENIEGCVFLSGREEGPTGAEILHLELVLSFVVLFRLEYVDTY